MRARRDTVNCADAEGCLPEKNSEIPHDADSLLTADDLYLFNEGNHTRLYEKLGSHPRTVGGVAGTSFAVFAPNAQRVWVMGDFNGWSKESHPLSRVGESGVWEAFVPGVSKGAVYKYHILSRLAQSS